MSLADSRASLLVAVCLALAPVACAQGGAPADESPVTENLSAMEAQAGAADLSGRSLFERVSALEMHVFGATRKGSLVDRLDELKRALTPGAASGSAGAAPPPAPPAGAAAPDRQEGYVREGVVNLSRAVPLADMWPPRFVRIEPAGSQVKDAGDYFADVMKATKNKIFKFKAMPIPVYITPYQERGFTEAVIAGFEEWERRTGEEIRFVQVDNPESARIRVIWSQLGLNADGKGCTLGAHTLLKWTKRPSGSVAVVSMGVVPVPIYIPKVGPKYTVPPQIIEVNLSLIQSKNLEVRYIVLQNIVAHELGHALGLLGHSPNKSDLMYPITDEHSRLSPRDINTVLRVYGQKVDVPL